jgi:hypothetical protein
MANASKAKPSPLGPVDMEMPKPSITLTAKELPAVATWDVGKTYEVSLKVKMVGKNIDRWDSSKPISGTFEVVSGSDLASEDEAKVRGKVMAEPYGKLRARMMDKKSV